MFGLSQIEMRALNKKRVGKTSMLPGSEIASLIKALLAVRELLSAELPVGSPPLMQFGEGLFLVVSGATGASST